jgi:hypothetical protein
LSVLAEISRRAAADSPLWRDALAHKDADAIYGGDCPPSHLLGLEMIQEGELLHRGRSRLFRRDDPDLALLTGDYLYAAGLGEICATGDLEAVRALAELISETSCDRAEGAPAGRDRWLRAVARFSAGPARPRS